MRAWRVTQRQPRYNTRRHSPRPEAPRDTTRRIIIVVLAMIMPIEALRNALVNAFGQITQNLSTIQ